MLKEGIKKNIRFLAGELSAEVMAWKANAFWLFWGGGGQVVPKALLLKTWATGDWRQRGVIEFYHNPLRGELVDAAALREQVAEGISQGLLGCLPRIYNKSRWDGSDEATD